MSKSFFAIIPIGGEGTRLRASLPNIRLKPLTPLNISYETMLAAPTSITYQNIHTTILGRIDDQLSQIDNYCRSYGIIKNAEVYDVALRFLAGSSIVVKQEDITISSCVPGTLSAFYRGLQSGYSPDCLYVSGDHVFQDGMIENFVTQARNMRKQNCFAGVIKDGHGSKYYCDKKNIVQYISQADHLPDTQPPENTKVYEDVGLLYIKNVRTVSIQLSNFLGALRSIATAEERPLNVGLATFIESLHPKIIQLDPYQYVNVNTIEDIARAQALIRSETQ